MALELSINTTTTKEEKKKDIRWTDAQIRWPDDKVPPGDDETNDDDDDESGNPFDPFADPDPTEVFKFRFVFENKKAKQSTTPIMSETAIEAAKYSDDDDESESINLNIHGYKTGSDEVWQSTGLTLWKASKYLCDYMVKHADELRGQRVLELGAGLGLNGVLAHRLAAESVVITDGDSDAMVELRKNIKANRRRVVPQTEKVTNDDADQQQQQEISAAQMIWGKESAHTFLESIQFASPSSPLSSLKFSVIIASDIIYAAIVIDPLWETARALLRYPNGQFWMAFAVRKVPVTIDFVLQKAQEYGFRYELVDSQVDGYDYGDDNIEGDPETGRVFIYRFYWDETKAGMDATFNDSSEIEGS